MTICYACRLRGRHTIRWRGSACCWVEAIWFAGRTNTIIPLGAICAAARCRCQVPGRGLPPVGGRVQPDQYCILCNSGSSKWQRQRHRQRQRHKWERAGWPSGVLVLCRLCNGCSTLLFPAIISRPASGRLFSLSTWRVCSSTEKLTEPVTPPHPCSARLVCWAIWYTH